MNYKQVIVVRKDLNMRKGKLAAQVAHASVGSLTQLPSQENSTGILLFVPVNSPMYHWLKGSFVKIVVSCKDEEELLEIKSKADEACIQTVLITDAGHTEFHEVPTNTCVAIGPDTPEKIDRITGELPLL